MRVISASLKAQLLAAFALVSAVAVLVAVVAVVSLSSVSGTLTGGAKRIDLAGQVSTLAYNMQGSELMNTLASGAQAANHAGDVQSFRAALRALGQDLATPADRADFQRLERAFAAWSVLDAQANRLAAAHELSRATALVTGNGAANAATDALATSAAAMSAQVRAENTRSANSSRRTALVAILALLAVGIAAAIAIALLLARRVAGGVGQMLTAAQGLAQGDVEQSVEIRSRDEVGAMGRAFATMIEYLRATAASAREIANGNFAVEIEPRSERDVLNHAFLEMRDRVGAVVRAISSTSEALNTSSAQVAATTADVGRAIEEIADSVGEVARGAELQVRVVGGARNLSEEVKAASRASSERARETADAAERARQASDDGAQAVAQVDTAMRTIQDSSAQVSIAIRELGQKSQRIGGITDTITRIAEQTNLLALNAAIEAARAGEQGRGFAVVAEEIRTLAEESQEAATAIAGLIGEIHAETDRAVGVVEHGVQQTNESAQTVVAAGAAFGAIRESVAAMNDQIEQIAAASAQIAESAEQMSSNVASVASVAEQS